MYSSIDWKGLLAELKCISCDKPIDNIKFAVNEFGVWWHFWCFSEWVEGWNWDAESNDRIRKVI